jgi:hypothetical protein
VSEVLSKSRAASKRPTTINGVADKLKAVSAELDLLPSRFDVFLFPSAGAFNCRRIAGTDKVSPHGYGIAVDVAFKRAHYWMWDSVNNCGKELALFVFGLVAFETFARPAVHRSAAETVVL